MCRIRIVLFERTIIRRPALDPKEFEKQYMCRLNARQKEAVFAVDGPVLLLATPGSGKTTVLVTRLGYMVLCRGIDPKSILTMTYTVAATKDMKSRFTAFFGEAAAEGLQFRTINSVSKSIIDYFGRSHAGRASRRRFVLSIQPKQSASSTASL